MNIIIYNSNAEKNRLDKKTFLREIGQVDGTLRAPSSVLNPVITFQLVALDWSLYPQYEKCINANYAYIPDFNRYYFITDIVAVRNDLWQISMRVDVLMSYLSEINNLEALIARNEFTYNSMIRDDNIFLRYDKEIYEYEPKNEFDDAIFISDFGKYISSTTHQVVGGQTIFSVGTLQLPLNQPNTRITKIRLSFWVTAGTDTLSYAFYTNNDATYLSGETLPVGEYIDYEIDVPKNASTFKFTYRNDWSKRTSVKTTNIISFGLSDDTIVNNIVMTTIEYNSENQKDAVWYWNPVNAIPDNDVMSRVQPRETEVVGYSQPWLTNYQTFEAISLQVAKNDKYASYVINSVVYPFEIPAYRDPTTGALNRHDVILGDEKVNVGTEQVPVYLSHYQLAMKQSPIIKSADFIIEPSYNSYLDYDPYTKYELYIPYCQWITLSPEQILGHRLKLYYLVTYTDGSAFAYLIDTTDNKLIWGGSCQLGINVPVSTSNSLEIQKAKDANALNMIMGLVASGVTTALGVASANPVAITGGVLSGANTIANYISKDSQMFEKGQCTVGSGNFGLYAPQKVRIRITRVVPLDSIPESDYAHLYGKPCNKYRLISEMTGFTQIGEIHLENIPTATDSELTAIEEILKSGIII